MAIPFQRIQDVIDRDFPAIGPVTEKTREVTEKMSGKFRGSVRISMGKFLTDAEYRDRKMQAYRRSLP